MKVGDKVWVETNWQRQLGGAPPITEVTIMRLTPGLVLTEYGNLDCRALYDRKEDIVKRVRERLRRECSMAFQAVTDAQERQAAKEQELREFEETYS